MKVRKLLSAVVVSTLLPAAALAKTATVDVDSSKLFWLGKKVTGQHNGTIALKSGQIEVEGQSLKGGRFEIDMNSIAVEDLKDPEYNKKLVNHLKSDDFFGSDKHPVSTFTITKVKPASKKVKDATHEITGDLTIKGVTQPVTFPAKVEIKDGQARATGKLMIDRTKYNVRYGSGKFFENLGDKMINDEFELKLDITSQI